MFKVTEKLIRSKFYCDEEAAGILGVNQSRIRQLHMEGRFAGEFKIGNTWLIPREEVDNFVRKNPGRKSKSKPDSRKSSSEK